jgi:hypothetical protein
MRHFKTFLIVLPALVLIAVFVGVSGYLRYGTQLQEFGPADDLEAFQDGYRLERDGELDGASPSTGSHSSRSCRPCTMLPGARSIA